VIVLAQVLGNGKMLSGGA